MRVLVTGGLGFLGHAIVRRLVDDGHRVTALTSRPHARSFVAEAMTAHADIRDRTRLARLFAEVRPEGICHLAALTRVRDSFADPLSFFDVNVGGTIALLNALDDAGTAPVPIVFASTGSVYGPAEGRIHEDHPTNPTNPYGASKLAAEQLLIYHARTGAIGATILRSFNITGAVDGIGDTHHRFHPQSPRRRRRQSRQAQHQRHGTAIREFTHVADVATACSLALNTTEPGRAHVYNVGSGVQASMHEVLHTVEDIAGVTLPTEHLPPKPEPPVLMADSDMIRAKLAWRPTFVELRQIIAEAWTATR